MEIAPTRKTTRTRALAAALAVACLLAGLVATAERADSAPLRILILGKTQNTPQPDCPGKYQIVAGLTETLKPCLGDGHLTAFQVSADGVTQPTKVPFSGKVVSWSVSLGKPSRRSTEENPSSDGIYRLNELGFFNELLDKPAQARIAILRPVLRADRKTFKMVRQSPVQVLNPYFGTSPQFVLENPLSVVKDQIVAITIPTWAPILSTTEPSSSLWRASRKNGSCFYPENAEFEQLRAFVDKSFPQQKVGSDKEYTCTYEAQRLLYTATLIRKPGG